jgi:hypothetical protein
MDELAKSVILGAPNLAVALWTLFWAFRALERKDAAMQKLTDALLATITEREKLRAQLNGNAPPRT